MPKQIRQTVLVNPERSNGEQRLAEKIESLEGGKLQTWLRKALIVGLAIENGNPTCFEMMATYAQLESGGSISEKKLMSFLQTFAEEGAFEEVFKASTETKPKIEPSTYTKEQEVQEEIDFKGPSKDTRQPRRGFSQ